MAALDWKGYSEFHSEQINNGKNDFLIVFKRSES